MNSASGRGAAILLAAFRRSLRDQLTKLLLYVVCRGIERQEKEANVYLHFDSLKMVVEEAI